MFAIAGRHQGFETFCNASDCCVSGLLSGSLVRNCSLFRNSPFRTLRRLVSELCRLERGTAIWRCTNLAHTRGSCCVRRSAAHCNRSSITLCLFAGIEEDAHKRAQRWASTLGTAAYIPAFKRQRARFLNERPSLESRASELVETSEQSRFKLVLPIYVHGSICSVAEHLASLHRHTFLVFS